MSTRSPILFLVFNRPDTTQRVFEAIRAARPSRLYVAADGARDGRADDEANCAAVRNIATAVDWPCNLATLLRSQNLGCKRAVSSAISWFFEQEPEGIVLEDDCLPDASFFTYCDELLARYREDARVMCISGDNFISRAWQPTESYYFSSYAHVWGWASWRRAWQHYDVNMRSWRAQERQSLLERIFPHSRQARSHWRLLFDRVSTGQIDTWDYQWTFACWQQNGLSCMPRVNLISNIGFGEGATHTVSPESKLANLPAESLACPLQHPDAIMANVRADQWTNEHIFEIDESRLGFRRWRDTLGSRLRRTWSAVVG